MKKSTKTEELQHTHPIEYFHDGCMGSEPIPVENRPRYNWRNPPPILGEKNEGLSKTIPDQLPTIRELLAASGTGQIVYNLPDGENDMKEYDLNMMEPIERAMFAEQIQDQLDIEAKRMLNEHLNAEQRQKYIEEHNKLQKQAIEEAMRNSFEDKNENSK